MPGQDAGSAVHIEGTSSHQPWEHAACLSASRCCDVSAKWVNGGGNAGLINCRWTLFVGLQISNDVISSILSKLLGWGLIPEFLLITFCSAVRNPGSSGGGSCNVGSLVPHEWNDVEVDPPNAAAAGVESAEDDVRLLSYVMLGMNEDDWQHVFSLIGARCR